MNNKISIIIPFYYSQNKNLSIGENLPLISFEKCLSAVFASNYRNYEIIAVSDCSSKESIRIAKKYPCKIVKLKKNSGSGNSRNVGARLAKGKILLFLDSDVEIKKDALMLLNKRYNSKNDIVAIQGVFSHSPNYKKKSTQYLQSYFCYHLFSEVEKKKYTETACTSFFSIKKDMFFKLNGFQSRFKKANAEDSEFGIRLIKSGYKIPIERKISVNHHTSFGLWQFILRIIRIHTGEMKMYLRNKSFLSKIKQSNYFTVIFGLFLISSILTLLVGNYFYSIPYFVDILISLNLLFILIHLKFLKFIYSSKGFFSAFRAIFFSYLHRFLFICCIGIGILDFYVFKNKY